MQYKGGGYIIRSGLDKYNDSFYNHIEIIYQKNNIEPELDNESSADLYRGNIDWIRAWKLKTGSDLFSVFIGGHLLCSYGAMNHKVWANNSFSHSLALNLGPSFVLSVTPFSSSQDLLIALEVSVPLLNYIIRPSQGSILPDGTIKNGENTTWTKIIGGSITSLHEYQRIYSNIYLSTRITQRMNIRAGYQVDFQNYSVNNLYQSVNRLIYIGLHYRLKI